MKQYKIKTFPIMEKEYLVFANSEEEAIKALQDGSCRVIEYGRMNYSDHEEIIPPEIIETVTSLKSEVA